jgi:hypothetical protein
MTLIACWILFPLVLAGLSLGFALLVERAAGVDLPGELLLPTGFAAIAATTLFTTLSAATAPLTVPLVVAVGAVGLAASLPPSLRRFDGYAAAVAVGVFTAFLAPVIASGRATFTGYVKLDDTATFLALVDRALDHGRSLAGLAPSTYEATLAVNLPFYPLGSLLPLGIGARIVAQDTAWVFQPYLAFMAGLLGLSLYRLAGLVLVSRRARALAAFVAAQAALLYGYSLWGGVKEVAAAAFVALVAALTSDALHKRRSARALLPLGVASAALVGVLSVGAAVWLVPAAAIVVFTMLRRRSGTKPLLLVGAGLGLLVPSLAVARLMLGPGVMSSVRDKAELGNLVASLSPLQLLGVWPVGDFRFRPERMDVTYVLLAVVVLAAVLGVAAAIARRAWEVPVYLAGALGSAAVYAALSSPWIEAKSFAIAAPAVLLAALLGALVLYGHRRVEGAVVVGLIVFGVAWSNLLAYGDVTLAPRTQFAELETIGERFAGQGPALMTEYQPYGARHFLRRLDAEGTSELRRRMIPLRDGSTLPKASYADLAAFNPGAVLEFRTLVLRRSPVATRPPSPYQEVWRGRFYEVWQRPAALPVASRETPACDPSFRAGPGVVRISRPGSYELWVGGSVRGELAGEVDGRLVGKVRHQLNPAGQFTPVGVVELAAGPHSVRAIQRLSRLRPGEGGTAWTTGDVYLAPADRC